MPAPYVDMRVDYDTTPPQNQPDVTFGESRLRCGTPRRGMSTTGPAPSAAATTGPASAVIGSVGAPRLTASIINCQFALTGWDVIYEQGSAHRMTISFAPLRKDAVAFLIDRTGIDYSPSATSPAPHWFCCTARDDDGELLGVFIGEFLTLV